MSGIVGKNLGRGSGIVTATPVGADTVSGASIADDAIDSEHYTDGSIDNAHIADDAIDSEHYADGSIDNAHIADDAIDSEHYADGSIDNAHIADDAIDSEHYADGSIDNAHIADNAIDSEHYAAGSIDLEHMASESVDEDNLHISNSGSNGNFLSKQSGDAGGLTWAAASSALSDDSSPQLGGFLDANGNYIQMQIGGDIASASPTVIDTDGDFFACTGTTNFSAFTVAADRHFFLEFGGALTMTHGAGTLDLPGAANITTAASDVGEFVSTAANVVTCVNYTKRDGTAVVAAGGGKIGQVIQGGIYTSYSHTGGGSGVVTAITGFTAAITPVATSSKVLVILAASIANASTSEHTALQIQRGGTVIGGHTSLGTNRLAGMTGHQSTGAANNAEYNGGVILDSPATTSAVTYAVYAYSTGVVFYLNRPLTDNDTSHYVRGVSTITLMEVLA